MIVRLYEAKWLHHIAGELASNFHKAIDAAEVEAVRASSIALLEKCKEFFDPEEQDYVIFELEDLIESFSEAEASAEEMDFLLEELYDFCDGYNIFIDTVEEKEPEVEPELPHEEHEEDELAAVEIEEPVAVIEPEEGE